MKKAIELYNEAQTLYECQKEHARRAEEIKNERFLKVKDYRIASVHDVLSFVRDNRSKISDKNMDVLLCHCLNKLNGNIDGVELTLDDHFFTVK